MFFSLFFGMVNPHRCDEHRPLLHSNPSLSRGLTNIKAFFPRELRNFGFIKQWHFSGIQSKMICPLDVDAFILNLSLDHLLFFLLTKDMHFPSHSQPSWSWFYKYPHIQQHNVKYPVILTSFKSTQAPKSDPLISDLPSQKWSSNV